LPGQLRGWRRPTSLADRAKICGPSAGLFSKTQELAPAQITDRASERHFALLSHQKWISWAKTCCESDWDDDERGALAESASRPVVSSGWSTDRGPSSVCAQHVDHHDHVIELYIRSNTTHRLHTTCSS